VTHSAGGYRLVWGLSPFAPYKRGGNSKAPVWYPSGEPRTRPVKQFEDVRKKEDLFNYVCLLKLPKTLANTLGRRHRLDTVPDCPVGRVTTRTIQAST
jgi:hypothetical protein